MATPVLADVVWDEAVDGELSDDALNPTVLTLGVGSNTLLYNVVTEDFDYFTFNIPAGQQLQSIHLKSFNSPGGDVMAFLSILDGATFSVTPLEAFGDPDLLKGWAHISPFVSDPGENLLTEMGVAAPQPAGDYSFWAQQTGASTDIELEFVVVPEPGSLALAGLGGLALLRRRR